MKHPPVNPFAENRPLLAVTAALLVVLIYGGFRLIALNADLAKTKMELAATTVELEGRITELEGTLRQTTSEKENLATTLGAEQQKNDYFESQIDLIEGTVGQLDKLSKLDPQLLLKYSKIFFLNENYKPTALATVSETYLYNKSKPQRSHASVWPFLQSLLAAARSDGVELSVLSGYRSFGEQADLKYGYTVVYGAGSANQFSADQGYSEHQLGTAVDFMAPGVSPSLVGFDTSEAYTWLNANAYKYGFILSYPEGNDYYRFEPWHWRFVGTQLANVLKTNSKYFYDLDQREISSFLITIFD